MAEAHVLPADLGLLGRMKMRGLSWLSPLVAGLVVASRGHHAQICHLIAQYAVVVFPGAAWSHAHLMVNLSHKTQMTWG